MNSISNLIKGFDHVAQGSNTEIRDNSNVGMDGGIENHSFDLSTRDAINLMNQRKAEGKPITGDDMKAVIKNLADSGQITREEWMDLREYVTKNYDSLSPEAKATFDKLDTALQNSGNQVGWKDGLMDGGTRFDAVIKGPELKTLLDSIDGKTPTKPKDSVDHGQTTQGSSNGGSSSGTSSSSGNGGVKPPESGHTSGTSGASGGGHVGGPGAGASWGEIIAYLMQLIDAKEKDLKQAAMQTANDIDGLGKSETQDMKKAEGEGTAPAPTGSGQTNAKPTDAAGEGKESLNAKLANIQDQMKKLDQLTEMMTNLLNSTHQTTSKVIGNIR
jgi:hypothetical protein